DGVADRYRTRHRADHRAGPARPGAAGEAGRGGRAGAEPMSATLFDYWRSSASYRVRIALNLKGISYSRIPVSLLDGAQLSPDNLVRNPQGMVPTLAIDGLELTQSLAIIAYLDRRDPA